MIKANELRLGVNIYYDDIFQHGNSPNLKIIKIDSGSIKWAQSNIEQFNRAHKPILITEELLLKFGFISNPYSDRYELGDFHIEHNRERGYSIFWHERSGVSIEHIHQLQNFYFALTGEELTLKQIT